MTYATEMPAIYKNMAQNPLSADQHGDHRDPGGRGAKWILKLSVAGGQGPRLDIMEINKPGGLGDITNPGLTLAEGRNPLACGLTAHFRRAGDGAR